MPNHAKGTTSGLHTASVHVGIPPRDISDTARTKVYCHGFANLDSQRGEMIESPVFHCLGIEWILQIYARGHNHEGEVDVISVAAIRRSSSKIRTHVEYKLANKREVKFGWDAICGHSIPRCTGLVNLVQGALVVEVRMWPEINPSYFIPDNPSACKTVQALFTDEESADVVFEVGMDPTKNEPTSQSEINTSCIKFSAHYNILKVAAPQLADFVKKSNESPTVVKISNTSSNAFLVMLQYIYGFETPPFGIDLPFAKEIIETADRYGVTNLKLEAEATYVSILTLTLENVMENLLFAESKNCALVKEEAMNFIVLNKVEVLKKNMLIDAPGGLYADILSAVVRSEGKAGSLRLEDKFVSMNISELRRQANDKGLEFDGSREALISALGYYESGDM